MVKILRTTYCRLLRHVLVSQHNPALSGRDRCLRREVAAGEGTSYFPARSSRTPRRWPEDCGGVASSGRPASRKRPGESVGTERVS